MSRSVILNPKLYSALLTRFGDVKVASPGEQYVGHVMTAPYANAKDKTKPEQVEECIHAGEYYCVCCPYCRDERFRLWVNHRWNTLDAKGQVFGRNLIICYNEGCDLTQFHKELHFFRKDLPRIIPRHVTGTEAEIFKPARLPGKCIPVNALPSWHPAVTYLMTKRKNPYGQIVPFEPERMWRDWEVHYCEVAERNAGYAYEFVENRLIFPIRRNSVLVGWQARAIDDTQPKYYTMPGTPKRHLLVNGERARNYPLGVVIEGLFDLASVGPIGMAVLGKHLSYWQLGLLSDYFHSGMVCFLLDPDAAEYTRKNVEMLSISKAFDKGCFGVTLAPGWDAGALTQDQLIEIIRAEGKRQGFNVP